MVSDYDAGDVDGVFSGTVEWYNSFSDVITYDAFRLYFENDAGELKGLASPNDISAASEEYSVTITDKVITDETRIRFYTVTGGVESRTNLFVPLWDMGPEAILQAAHMVDRDPERDSYDPIAAFDPVARTGPAKKYGIVGQSEYDLDVFATAPINQSNYELQFPYDPSNGVLLYVVVLLGEKDIPSPWGAPIRVVDNVRGTTTEPFVIEPEGESPSYVTFLDGDEDVTEIGGILRWETTEPFGSAEILFANDAGTLWTNPLLSVKSFFWLSLPVEESYEGDEEYGLYHTSVMIPMHTPIPAGATRIAIYDRESNGPPSYLSLGLAPVIVSTTAGVIVEDGVSYIPRGTNLQHWFDTVEVTHGATKQLLYKEDMTPVTISSVMLVKDDYVLRVSLGGVHSDFAVRTLSGALKPSGDETSIQLSDVVSYLQLLQTDVNGDHVYDHNDILSLLKEISPAVVEEVHLPPLL